MKNLKIYFLIILTAVFFTACEEDESNELELVPSSLITIDQVGVDFFDFTLLSAGTTVDLTIGATDAPGLSVSSVDVLVARNGGANVNLRNVGLGELVITSGETLDALGLSVGDVQLGDVFTYTFVANISDGSKGTSGNTFAALVNCVSEIPEGGWTSALPGAGQDPAGCNLFQGGGIGTSLTNLGGGVYELANFDFGYFGQCCGNIRAQFVDVCNDLTLTGTTEFGIVWTGVGTYIPDGGANGNGQIVFECHYDATFGGSAATDTILLDKD